MMLPKLKEFYMKKQYVFTFLILMTLINQTILGQFVLLSAPIFQAVYQRDNTNFGFIPIAGQIVNSTGNSYRVECITSRLDANGAVIPGSSVTSLITNATVKGVFNGTVGRLSDWFSISIRCTNNVTNATTTVTSKCGIGDVFIIAGQSNAQGDNGASFTTTSIPDWVVGNVEEWNCRKEFEQRPIFMSKINGGNRISPAGNNSWCYGVLGKKISDANGGIPVAFFNTAASGSSVKNWRDGAYANYLDATTAAKRFNDLTQWCINFVPGQTDPLYYIGQPYLTLRNVLNWYVPLFGVRAILWHQGEVDAFNSFNPNSELTRNSATYTQLLNDVISKSRADLGNNNLSWMIAQVSYSSDNITGGTLSPNFNATSARNGQAGSVNGSTVRSGPLTDRYNNASTGIYRYDNTHFSEGNNGGLTVLANLWNSPTFIDNSASSLTAFNRISSMPVPSITITQSGSNYTYSVPVGANAYCWTTGSTLAPPLSGCLSTSNSYPNNSGTYRCYIRTGNNWQSTAQVTQVNCPGCRESSEESDETYGGINMKLYPNPSDKDFRVEFDVPEDDTHVKLEFFDMMGNSVKVIADGSHAKGHFTYPITESLPTGVSICQLKVGEIFISKKMVKVN